MFSMPSSVFGFFVFGFILFCVHGFVMSTAAFTPAAPIAEREARREEAIKLLNEGINEKNQHQAMALILSYESGHIPNTPPQPQPQPITISSILTRLTFWLPLAAYAALCYPPRTALGLTRKGQRSIERQRRWADGFLRKFIFGTLVVGFVAKLIHSWASTQMPALG
jgi:hypothetical protein